MPLDATPFVVTPPRVPNISIGPNPPPSPVVGDLWYDSQRGFLFIWYNDSSTIQWVVANPGKGSEMGPPGPPGLSIGPAGGVLSGLYPDPGFAPNPHFSGGVYISGGSNPVIEWLATTNPVDAKTYWSFVDVTGSLVFQRINDARNAVMQSFWFGADGRFFIPAPLNTDNQNNVATTKWVIDKGYMTAAAGDLRWLPLAGGRLTGNLYVGTVNKVGAAMPTGAGSMITTTGAEFIAGTKPTIGFTAGGNDANKKHWGVDVSDPSVGTTLMGSLTFGAYNDDGTTLARFWRFGRLGTTDLPGPLNATFATFSTGIHLPDSATTHAPSLLTSDVSNRFAYTAWIRDLLTIRGLATAAWKYGNTSIGDPGTQFVNINIGAGNDRTLSISKTDADNTFRYLMLLLAGDTLVIQGDPDRPAVPPAGFVRYVLTADPQDNGTWVKCICARVEPIPPAELPNNGVYLRITGFLNTATGEGPITGVYGDYGFTPESGGSSGVISLDIDPTVIATAADYVKKVGDDMTGRLRISMPDNSTLLLLNGSTKGVRFNPTASAFSIEGVDATGVTSYQPLQLNGSDVRFGLPGETMRLTSAGLGIGVTPSGGSRLHTLGAGQSVINPSTVAGLGATAYLQDSGTGGGNGGMLMFGAAAGAFAAIKGYYTDGAGNTRGDLIVSTRRQNTDATLTHLVKFRADGMTDFMGNVGIGGGSLGNVRLTLTGQTPATDYLIWSTNSLGAHAFSVQDNGNVTISGSTTFVGTVGAAGFISSIDTSNYALLAGRYSAGFGKAVINTRGDYGYAFQVNGSSGFDYNPGSFQVNGSITAGFPGSGQASLYNTSPANAGYVAFFLNTGVRTGYIGFNTDRIAYISEIGSGIHHFNGKLGIGDTPDYQLDVRSDSGTNNTVARIQNHSQVPGSNSYIIQTSGGRSVPRYVEYTTQILREYGDAIYTRYSDFDSQYFRRNDGWTTMTLRDGYVGIGDWTAPNNRLLVRGQTDTDPENVITAYANNMSQGLAIGWTSIRKIGLANTPLNIDANGTGNINIAYNSTGAVLIGRDPPGGSNDTNVATTRWVNQRIPLYIPAVPAQKISRSLSMWANGAVLSGVGPTLLGWTRVAGDGTHWVAGSHAWHPPAGTWFTMTVTLTITGSANNDICNVIIRRKGDNAYVSQTSVQRYNNGVFTLTTSWAETDNGANAWDILLSCNGDVQVYSGTQSVWTIFYMNP